ARNRACRQCRRAGASLADPPPQRAPADVAACAHRCAPPEADRDRRADGGQSRGTAEPEPAGAGGGTVDAPARTAVQAPPRSVAEALLPGASPQEGAPPAAADQPVGNQCGAGVRFLVAVTLLQVLPRLLRPHALSRTRNSQRSAQPRRNRRSVLTRPRCHDPALSSPG